MSDLSVNHRKPLGNVFAKKSIPYGENQNRKGMKPIMNNTVQTVTSSNNKTGYLQRCKKDWRINKKMYFLFIPVIVYYLVFCYAPMYGAIIAFKDFSPIKGILGSDWVGFAHFKSFFTSPDFGKLMFNTLNISLNNLLWGFPAPIILALLLNEVRSTAFKKTIQTVSYMPHFISIVVACGMIKMFVADNGIITRMLAALGLVERESLLGVKQYFVPIYVVSAIWQEIGWGSIIYLAALAGIGQDLYEAAWIDGAGRFRQMLHVTLPGLAPTIVVMLILRMGTVMTTGFEKIILLYNPLTYDTADVISSYVYRRGLVESNFSYSTAVGLFNAVINFILIIAANRISRAVNGSSLW